MQSPNTPNPLSDVSALMERFPWLVELEPLAREIVDTLLEKEAHYQGSWQKRGGVGAFMMLCRKWDRIENIAQGHRYDIFEALLAATGGVEDDILDLIGYLLLCLADNRRRTMSPRQGGPASILDLNSFPGMERGR